MELVGGRFLTNGATRCRFMQSCLPFRPNTDVGIQPSVCRSQDRVDHEATNWPQEVARSITHIILLRNQAFAQAAGQTLPR